MNSEKLIKIIIRDIQMYLEFIKEELEKQEIDLKYIIKMWEQVYKQKEQLLKLDSEDTIMMLMYEKFIQELQYNDVINTLDEFMEYNGNSKLLLEYNGDKLNIESISQSENKLINELQNQEIQKYVNLEAEVNEESESFKEQEQLLTGYIDELEFAFGTKLVLKVMIKYLKRNRGGKW